MDAQQLADIYRQAMAAEADDQQRMTLPTKVVMAMAVRCIQGQSQGGPRVRCPECGDDGLAVVNVNEAPLVTWKCLSCQHSFRAITV